MTIAEVTTSTDLPMDAPGDTAADLVESWALRCIESGCPPSEELTEDDLADLDGETLMHFARAGAVASVNNWLHHERGRPVDDDEETAPRRSPMHACQGRNPTFWRALGIAVVGADGVLKSLVRFSLPDLQHLAAEAGLQQTAWASRKAWAKAATKALKAHGAETLEKLPAEVLADLDTQAERAWKR